MNVAFTYFPCCVSGIFRHAAYQVIVSGIAPSVEEAANVIKAGYTIQVSAACLVVA